MTVLTWEFAVPGGPVLHRVDLDDTGGVLRRLGESADPDGPQVGWWQGRIPAGLLGECRRLADEDWPAGPDRGRPAAGGSWSAAGARGRVGLDAGDRSEHGAARRELLAAGLECADAAVDPVAVTRLTGTVASTAARTDLPVLHAEGVGSQPLTLRVAERTGVVAAWVDDDGEVHGFLGDEVVVPAGVRLVCALADLAIPAAPLELGGTMARVGEAAVPVRLFVEFGPAGG